MTQGKLLSIIATNEFQKFWPSTKQLVIQQTLPPNKIKIPERSSAAGFSRYEGTWLIPYPW